MFFEETCFFFFKSSMSSVRNLNGLGLYHVLTEEGRTIGFNTHRVYVDTLDSVFKTLMLPPLAPFRICTTLFGWCIAGRKRVCTKRKGKS